MQSSNPSLLTNPFSGLRAAPGTEVMTVRGTVNKTLMMLVLVFLPAAWVWKMVYQAGPQATAVHGWMWGGLIGGLVFSIATIFKKEWAPFTAPLYAVAEGLFLGGISSIFQQAYPGIVAQAVSLSVATMLVMLVAYQSGWVKATENFRLGVIAATGGIAIVYFVAIILGFFGINVGFISGSGIFSILFSVFVVIIAALNFIIDFDFIAQASRYQVPKYMEWYGAFALMVTLIWLYIEILRLLAKLNDRR